jgi:hypothetical protein
MMRTVVAACVTLLVVLLPTPAHAEVTAPPGIAGWEPSDVVEGSWQPKDEDATPLALSGDRHCDGRIRSWTDGSRTIGLAWYACDSADMSAWVAHFEEERRGLPPAPQHAASLGADYEVVLISSGEVGRLWLQDRYVVLLVVDCAGTGGPVCLETNGRIAVDISGRMPGDPMKLVGGRSQVAASFLVSVLVLWMVALAVAMAWRRIRRVRLTSVDTVRSRSVDKGAASLRRKSRLRRVGIALLFPSVGFVAVSAPSIPAAAFDVTAFVVLLALILFLGLPGVVLLWLSRGMMSDVSWRWYNLRQRRTWGHRLVTAGLGALSIALLVLTLVTAAMAFGADRLIGLPPFIVDAGAALFFPMAFGLWLVSRAARRRARSDAWGAINSRSGPPLTVVRGLGETTTSVRIADLPAPGVAAWLRRALRPQRKQRFDEALAGMLARYGPVSTIDLPGPRLPDPPTRRVGLPAEHWQSLLSATTADAAGVVVAPAAAGGASLVAEVTSALAAAGSSGRLMIVLPPSPPDVLGGLRASLLDGRAHVHPFATLDAAWALDGALVLLHVPDQGWLGWSSSQRDEWSYVQAIHEALVYAARYWPQPAERPVLSNLVLNPQRTMPPRVMVVAAPPDDWLARHLSDQMADMGLAVSRSGSDVAVADDVSAAVIVLSEAAATDSEWRAEVVRWADAGVRLVPVQHGVIGSEVPEVVRELNWIAWTPAEPAAVAAQLFAAVNSRLARYRIHRDLTTQARAWLAAGRAEARLIDDHGRARAAAAHIADAANDLLARPSPVVHEYVQASLSATRRQRFHLRRRAVGVLALVLAAAALIAYALPVVRLQGQNNRIIAALVGLPLLGAQRPDRVALLAGAAIVQGSAQQAQLGREVLRRTLNESWPRTLLGAVHDSSFRDADVTGPDSALTLDGRGTLTSWQLSTSSVRWRYRVADDVTALDATAAGELVAIGGGRSVHLVQTAPWRRQTREVPADVERVAVSATADLVVVGTADGQVFATRASSFDPLSPVVAGRSVMDLRSDENGRWVRALVRTGEDSLDLVDVGTRATIRSWRVGLGGLTPLASIGPDGQSIAVIDAAGDLRFGSSTGEPRWTGQRVLDPVDDLAVLPQGEIVVVGRQFGVTIVDPRLGIVTARLGATQVMVTKVRAAADGALLLCVSPDGVFVWAADDFALTVPPPSAPPPANQTSASAGGVSVDGGADGVLTIARDGAGQRRIRVAQAAVTAVAVDPDGRSVLAGAADGTVIEFDPGHDQVVRRWRARDNSVVTALGWSATEPDRILVQTRNAIWWRLRGCPECGADSALLSNLRGRLWGCYLAENLDGLNDRSRSRLGVRVCRKSPAAREG